MLYRETLLLVSWYYGCQQCCARSHMGREQASLTSFLLASGMVNGLALGPLQYLGQQVGSSFGSTVLATAYQAAPFGLLLLPAQSKLFCRCL